MPPRAPTSLSQRMSALTADLCREHDDLRRALTVLAAIARRMAAGQALPVDDCAAVLRYLRQFAVSVHFAKEAETLLRAVAARGSDADVAVAGRILRAQEDARQLINLLALLWEPSGRLDADERRGFAEAVTALRHVCETAMHLEETALFRAAAAVPADDRLGWPEAVSAIETQRSSAADWRPLLDALARRWT